MVVLADSTINLASIANTPTVYKCRNSSIFILPQTAAINPIIILYNQLAGAGRAATMAHRLGEYLKGKGRPFQLIDRQWPSDLSLYSEAWIVGGDGTVNHFVNKYPEAALPLVIFNGGTGNDIHWLLYGELSLEQQLEKIEKALPRKLDLATCNDRYFLNGIGIGFEGVVAKDLAGKIKKPGKTSFLIAILKRVLFYRSKRYRIESAESIHEKAYLIIDVANGQRAGGGFHIAPASAIDDGLLDVVMVNKLTPLLRLRYLPVIEKGRHLSLPFIKHFRTKKIIIESDQDIMAHLDGELYTARKMEIGVLPGRLSVRY